ncbi:laccase-2-like isoform X2 [Ischnura elegans]|uniref:laccase-2-like isoform X2 n=1 Tax=Ischnura elegans TaxID=197161 RepID=UPI001ED8BAAC|nr:laccase-2-like isoform X2 [Ischnura elegans]
MSTGKTFFLRSALFVGLVSVVTTIIYFTPEPDRTFLSCERPCHELDWPMICRLKLTLEVYQTHTWSCGDCPSNQTDCFNPNCVTADGVAQALLTANRQLPGPSIQVCENDILVVDVWNRVPGAGLGVHWRGMPQRETPFMDGVPMVTQCPIPAHTTFQYKFRASKAGTHLWHAHSGAESADGLFGALVVRQPSSKDPHRALYDVDDPDHVIVLAEWSRGFALQRLADAHAGDAGEPDLVDTLLINGRGEDRTLIQENEVEGGGEGSSASPVAAFKVRAGLRHRFRVAHAGGVAGCPLRLAVDGHTISVIALDGNPIRPSEVKSFILSPGERADFILSADQPIGEYWMRVVADKGGRELTADCQSLSQKALIRYATLDYKPRINYAFPETMSLKSSRNAAQQTTPRPDRRDFAAEVLLNSVDEVCEKASDVLCVTEVHGLKKMDPELATPKLDRTLYVPFDFQMVSTDNVSYPPFLVPGNRDVRVPRVANFTFMYPPSPLVSQANDIPSDLRCGQDTFPRRCPTTRVRNMSHREEDGQQTENETDVCECLHQIDITLGETVEMILVDEGGASDWGHVFHMHGYSFHVVAIGSLEAEDLKGPRITEAIKDLDRNGKIHRNLVDPILKDTVSIPNRGYAVLRFKADNPGYWLLHDQHVSHSSWGLNVILHVGRDDQMPPPPPGFPKCGSWIGPEFFLI